MVSIVRRKTTRQHLEAESYCSAKQIDVDNFKFHDTDWHVWITFPDGLTQEYWSGFDDEMPMAYWNACLYARQIWEECEKDFLAVPPLPPVINITQVPDMVPEIPLFVPEVPDMVLDVPDFVPEAPPLP